MELLRNDDTGATRGAGEAHLRADSRLLETLHDAVILLEPDQRIRFWNDSAVRLYGWTADEVRGRAIADVLRTEFPASAASSANLAHAVEQAGRLRTQLVQYARYGKRIEVESVATALRGADGRLTGFLVAHRDVTESRSRTTRTLPWRSPICSPSTGIMWTWRTAGRRRFG